MRRYGKFAPLCSVSLLVMIACTDNAGEKSDDTKKSALDPTANCSGPGTPDSQGTTPPGPGPTASSPFLTADFQSPTSYPNGGTGQQVVSQKLWGTSGGGMGDDNFAIWTDPTFLSAMSKINPGVMYFKNSGQQYWNDDLSVRPPVLANLVNNFYKMDTLGITGVIIGADWGQVPGGDQDPNRYGIAMGNLAQYLHDYVMPNGNKFPLIGMMGNDEPRDEPAAASYYNAMIPRVKAVSNELLIVGPNLDYIGWTNFTAQVGDQIDVFSYDYYPSGQLYAFDDTSVVTHNNFAAIGDSASSVAPSAKALMFGGYNMDWNCSAPAMNSYSGALFVAWGMIESLNHSNRPQWGAIWDGYGDGTCGIITGVDQAGGYYGVTSTMRVTPKGYLTGQAVRSVHGPRWNMPINSAGLQVLATTPSEGSASIMIVNSGGGNQQGTVALSHWPVNATGNGSANVWQMTASVTEPGTDGTRNTVSVEAGVTPSLDFPDPSVTIISVESNH